MMSLLTSMTRVLFAGAFLLGSSAAYAQPDTNRDQLGIACDFTFTKGAGFAQISYCVNLHGNVMSFIAPAGVEHIRIGTLVDGYAICSANGAVVYGYDFGGVGESPWGASAVISGPTSTGVSLARTTADGQIRVEHAFKMDPAEGDVTVTVKVVNLSAFALAGVQYKRASDLDPAGANDGNLWTRSFAEVEAVNPTAVRGISLNAITFGTAHVTSIGDNLTYDSCVVPATEANGAVGNFSANIRYDLGTIQSLKSKSVKYVYKRK
jgi:hypothetical protein